MHIITNNRGLTSGYRCKWLGFFHAGMHGSMNSMLHFLQTAYLVQSRVGKVKQTVFTLTRTLELNPTESEIFPFKKFLPQICKTVRQPVQCVHSCSKLHTKSLQDMGFI